MVIHGPHVHPAGHEVVVTEGISEMVIYVFQDGEAEVELLRDGARGRDGINRGCHHLTPAGMNPLEISLQLHELLLTGASGHAFVEVDDELFPAVVAKGNVSAAARRHGHSGHTHSLAYCDARSIRCAVHRGHVGRGGG